MSQMEISDVLAKMQLLKAQAANRGASEVPEVDFAAMLKRSIDAVNATQLQANNLAKAFEQGEADVPLAEVMVSLEKAKVSFQAMVQVRNKLVEAYKDIMNMQI
jgi:flagellar hook-basal body complex protein FliE